ncbi:MAG TPA: CotH kinase family protein [Candidatus Acidoferrum sp.]|nr:CotH kinase family protein [Candidatus Acidoferrum sp.]
MLRSVLVLYALSVVSGYAQVRISEFMASNTHTLTDEDGQSSDWIEIQNTSGTNVNLLNWALTDSAGNPTKWLFPSVNLAPGGFMTVFASGQDRRTPGLPLHTNFKLDADGEYLALVRPDLSVATEISPAYPPQFPDVSYGVEMRIKTTTLVASNAAIRYWIPTNASVDGTWTQTNFNDATWSTGTNGIGYETGIADPQEESFAAKVLASQPVAYWRLNETNGPEAVNSGTQGVGDEAGYAGGIVLGAAGPRPPQFGTFETTNSAPLFDGTSAFVNGPHELVNDLPAFTLAGWIKPTATQPAATGLFGQRDTITCGFNAPSTLQLWTAYGAVSVSYPFPNNEWHFVTALGRNGQLALYLDGILAGSNSVAAANFGDSAYDFNIGGGGIFDDSGNFFTGQIDEVAVWFRALATNEIAAFVATNAEKVDYTPYLKTDVRTRMYGSNATAYVRLAFNVADPSAYDTLQLLMRYDDGFVAYLNGHWIASANAPATPAWNSAATQRHLDPQAVQWQAFDLSAAQLYLQPGNNVLAIQALNIAATNTDFLMQAQLLAARVTNTLNLWRYFMTPTPGGPNGTSTNDLGPIISGAGHFPNVPQVTDSLTVTARVTASFDAISNVTLRYKLNYNDSIPVPMNDAGTNGDAVAGDGIWTGQVPAGAVPAGQLLRYYIVATNVVKNLSRWPMFPDAVGSQQYLGTVVADPSVQSQLPVAYLFIQYPDDADDQTGTQASLFYQNELYDNLTIYLHGQSSTVWPKKSHNLDFPKDHQFLYKTNGVREKGIIFLSDYGDKARMRTTLAYSVLAQSGGVAFFSFPIRIQLNGAFWGIEDMVEKGDELFLDRVGRDPNGALYKMYNNLSTASGNEKKTREWEGTADLTALITNLDQSLPLATRVRYAYDHYDLPQTTSYFADLALVSDQSMYDGNYYLYHDNDGTGEWAMLPWDADLTWGRDWVLVYNNSNYLNDVLFQTNILSFNPGYPLQQGRTNRFVDLFLGYSDFRQMYLRRLRTLMDTILMPAGTPTNQLVIEPLIRQYESLLNPPAISPSDTALDYAAWGPTWGDTTLSQFPNDAERLISVHLPGRRTFLYTSPSAKLFGDPIPAAQPTNAVIYIASWDYSPAGGNPSQQYVELRNTNSYAVDVSNWELTGAIGIKLRPGTVIPAGKSLYLTPDVTAFRARTTGPGGGQNLYAQGPYSGFLSALGNSPLSLRNSSGWLVASNSYAAAGAAPFSPGNLAVLRLGDGAESLSSHGNSGFIDQFTTNGLLVGTIALPDNGPNALIISGSANSEGALTRSADRRLLTLAGYQIALTNSTSSLANSSATNVPRALGVLDRNGVFGIAGATTNQYSGNNVRSGATDGRGNYWGAGANSGTFYFGGGTSATVQNAVANTLVIQDLGGDLYFSTSKSTPGIWKMAGTPVSGPVTPAVYLSAGSGSSPYAFAFNANFTVAYVADDTLAGHGGVQRWDYSGGNWSLSYVFSGLTGVGARGLAVDFGGAHPVIYATTAESSPNRLVSLTDTGAASVVTTLATAGVNQLFKGVALAPEADNSPQFLGVSKGPGGCALTWTAFLGLPYRLQYNSDLATTNWITLTNVTATTPVLTVIDVGAVGDTNRFYRVILNP